MKSKIGNWRSKMGAAPTDVRLARRLLTEVLVDEARDIGWGPDVTNLGKLREALVALGGEVPHGKMEMLKSRKLKGGHTVVACSQPGVGPPFFPGGKKGGR